MGLFSKKKKIYVSSTSYNLAGDIENRVKFLPTTVMSYILKNDSSASMGETIVNSLLSGPGIKFRSFGRWARSSGYSDFIGLQAGKILVAGSLDVAGLDFTIPHTPDQSVYVQSADIGAADWTYWADQWMLENHPLEVDADYEIDFDEPSNTIIMTFVDGHVYTFQPVDFDPYAQYLYISYTLKKTDVPGPIHEGAEIVVGSFYDIPPVDGWTNVKNVDTPVTRNLGSYTTTTVSYSDGRPGSSSTSGGTTPTTWTDTAYTWANDVFRGQDPDALDSLYSDRTLQTNKQTGVVKSQSYGYSGDNDIGDGVIEHTDVTTTVEYQDWQYSYIQSSQKVQSSQWTQLKVIIYKKNSGNAIYDALFDSQVGSGDYFPFIPMRVGSRMVTGEIKEKNTKALKKATGAKYQKLEDSLADNKDVGDIDYAYIIFGVALNTKEEAARKYLFRFFQAMMASGAGGTEGYTQWQAQWASADVAKRIWTQWKQAQSDVSSPLYGTQEPQQIPYPKAVGGRLSLQGPAYGLNMNISWDAISLFSGSGLGKPEALPGQCWAVLGQTKDYDQIVYSAGDATSIANSKSLVTFTWQLTEDTYQSLAVWGLHHNYMIYKGKGVDILGNEAMLDTDESGFIIPLNEAIYRQMPLTEATQMSNAMGYMVLNSYQVVKQKWYQTSWFKIILIIIVIVVTVLSAGAGGASAGLLGTAASVGAALGFAGTVAIIVGTIANAIAAMILSQIIMMASTQIFGEKVGAIVGAIASVVAVSVGTSMANGGGVAGGFSSLSSAENLTRLTVAAGNGISGYLSGEASDTMLATQKLLDEYEEQSSQISKMYEQNLGFGRTYIDPTELTDVSDSGSSYVVETSSMFLGRTLMTGTDIASTTFNMLTNFAAITTSTQLPT